VPEDEIRSRGGRIFPKAKKLLGWGAKVSLEEGLRHTLEYFKEQYAKNDREALTVVPHFKKSCGRIG